MPGVPDIYRGCLGPHFALTDPDNRRPVDLDQLTQMTQRTGFAGQKARMSRALLMQRRAQQAFFEAADCQVKRDPQGIITLTRQHDDRTLTLRCDPAGGLAQTGSVWPTDPTDSGVLTVDID